MALGIPDSKKKLIINAFLEAAIAFELRGDWRNVFKVYSTKVIGKTHKQLKQWSTESDLHFNNAISVFLEER